MTFHRLALILTFATTVGCSSSAAMPYPSASNEAGAQTPMEAGPDSAIASESGSNDGAPVLESGATQADAGDAMGPFVTAAHGAPPTVPNEGGPTMGPVDLVTISYPSVAFDLGTYADALLASNWFSQVGAEYGVSGHAHLTDYVSPTAAPSSVQDAQIGTLIEGLVKAGTVPAPTSNTVYVIEYPMGTAITSAYGTQSCTNFAGYHASSSGGGQPIVYAVALPCASENAAMDTEAVVSHEILEAATDPFLSTEPAYVLYNDANNAPIAWYTMGGELADMCETTAPIGIGGGFWAQRIWSNAAAIAGTSDPCVPAQGPYYSTSATPGGVQFVVVAPSSQPQTVTFQLEGWSTAAVAPWWLSATSAANLTFDGAPVFANGTSIAQLPIQNGLSQTLTVTVPGGTQSGNYTGVAVISSATQPTARTTPLFGNLSVVGVFVYQ